MNEKEQLKIIEKSCGRIATYQPDGIVEKICKSALAIPLLLVGIPVLCVVAVASDIVEGTFGIHEGSKCRKCKHGTMKAHGYNRLECDNPDCDYLVYTELF